MTETATQSPATTSGDPSSTSGRFLPGPIVRASPWLWGVSLAVSGVWAMFDDQALFAFFGSLISMIVTLPLAHRRYSILSTWTPLALAITLSSGVRGLVQSLGIEGRLSIEQVWTLQHQPAYYVRPSLIYAAGVALMTVVYLSRLSTPSQHLDDPARFAGYAFSRWTPAVVTICALVGFGAFILYAQRTGGLSLASLSRKRTTITGLELDTNYQSHGELRYVNGLSAVAFWIQIAYYRLRPANSLKERSPWRAVVLLLLLANAVALPFYASSRSDVAHALLVAIAIRALLGKGGVKATTLITIGMIVYLAMAGMTFLRASEQSGVYDQFTAQAFFTSSTEGIIYDRNFGDLVTSGNIIGAIPNKLSYEKGATIGMWLIAPIPRAIWPSKPIITPGPTIGNVIYGTQRSGVPPGYMAEMYWNFSLAGVIVGGLALGWLLSYIDKVFPYQRLTRDPVMAVLYSVVFFRFGLFAISGGIGSAVFRSATDLAMTGAVLYVCKSDQFTAAGRATKRRGMFI